MSSIEWHQQQWPWVTLKVVTFAVWNLSSFHTSGNIANISCYVLTRESNSARDLSFQLSYWKWRTFLGHRHGRVHGKSSNISETVQRNRHCYYRSLIGNDMWDIAYRTVAIQMTLSDLQGHAPSEGLLKYDFFVHLCSSWQDFNWHSASRGPSSIAEPVVDLCNFA